MDINVLRGLLTLVLLLGFVALCVLLIMRGSGAYDDAAQLPFKEHENDE